MNTPLAKCREKEGITLTMLGKATGISEATLSRLERGTSTNLSGRACDKLIKHYDRYGLTLEQLVYPERHTDFVVK